MHRTLTSLVVALFATLSPALAADDADSLRERLAALEREVESLKASGADPAALAEIERRVEILTEEVEKLKIGASEEAVETSAGKFGLAPAASKVYGVSRGVSIGGYGELIYENFDRSREDGLPSGRTDQLDLARAIVYFGYKFNDSIVFNSEIEFEHATTGEGDEEKGEVSVEFAYVDFLLRDAVNVRTGLMLVPVGFVNEIHEGPAFLGAKRPLVETRILPTTWREPGVGVFGETERLTYRAYVVTGLNAVDGNSAGAEGYSASGIRGGRAGGSNAPAEDFALTGRLDVRPVAGLTVGASFFVGDAGQGHVDAQGTLGARTTIWDLHAEYRRRGLQARALYASTKIDDVARINALQGLVGSDSVGEDQYGAYLEVGYDVLAGREGRQALIPFVRRERLNTQDGVPAGFASNPANDVTVTTVGASWKPIPNVAVKLDWNKIENEARTGVDQINLAIGYLF